MEINKKWQLLKEKLSSGDIVYGIAVTTGSPIFIEMAGYSGFDFVYTDT